MDTDHSHVTTANSSFPIHELTSPKKVWECDICGFQSAFKTSLINHQAVHSDARPFECPVCEYAAKRKYDLKKHVQLKHGRDDLGPDLGKTDYASQIEGIYGAVVSSSGRANNDSLSPQHVSEHPKTIRSEILNLKFEHSVPKITVPRYVASSEKKRHVNLLDIKTEPCDRNDDDVEDANMAVSFEETCSPLHQEALSGGIGRETYSIIARERLTKVRNVPYMSPKQYNSSTSKPQSSVQAKNNEKHPLCPVGVPYTDTERGSYTHSHSGSFSQREKSLLGHSIYSGDSDIEGNRHHQKRMRHISSHADDPSSSMSCTAETPTHSEVSCSSVKSDKQSETKKTFACPHCDILYFDHALYLMHMGLHSSDSPWTCAVCGGDFWEKYSFTSHFINMHSQVTGE